MPRPKPFTGIRRLANRPGHHGIYVDGVLVAIVTDSGLRRIVERQAA